MRAVFAISDTAKGQAISALLDAPVPPDTSLRGAPPTAAGYGSRTAARGTGTATPVDVSFCTLAYASTPASAVRNAAAPPGAVCTVGSPRNGASFTTLANFDPNSPKSASWARSRTSPNAAVSQNALVPPLDKTTS